ncbi:hypothetical protein [Fodinicola feengrottensis]|uniref:hypothetical protein n=1 Tax=Fodinicola feengrottensis TaxID=435914 RepID=UPI00244254E6|nr:hypothetical protein [Fodinicola feengrottensis]
MIAAPKPATVWYLTRGSTPTMAAPNLAGCWIGSWVTVGVSTPGRVSHCSTVVDGRCAGATGGCGGGRGRAGAGRRDGRDHRGDSQKCSDTYVWGHAGILC